MSFNRIQVLGNLGADPELRYTPQGTPVCSFNLATNERRGENTETTWFKITLWGKQAEAASQYLAKGRQVYIGGTLRLEEWNDRDGAKRHTLAINGSDMQFVANGSGKREDSETTQSSTANDDGEEPPF
jgi:single-strand DNA-binding protein